MKLVSIISILLFGTTCGFSQSFLTIGDLKYELKCNDHELNLDIDDFCKSSTCSPIQSITKKYLVNKYVHEVHIGVTSPSPPYDLTSFSSYWTDSTIEVNKLVDTVMLSVDTLEERVLNLTIDGQKMKIVGYNIWAIGDTTIFSKIRGGESVKELKYVNWLLQITKRNFATIILSGIYYYKEDEYYFLNIDWECNFVQNIR